MTTIRDIAKLTGYSVSTVSRVINNNPQVSDQKRQAILKVMDELNYVPNKTAQNLSTGCSKKIGVIVPLTDQSYFDQLLKGVLIQSFKEDYRVTVLPTNYDKQLEMRYLREFAAKEYTGLIVVTRSNHLSAFQPYLKYGPVIFCEDVNDIQAGSVHIDLSGSLREVIQYLKSQGAKKVGLTLGRRTRKSCNSRKTIAICEELLPDFSHDDIFWDCYDGTRSEEAISFFKDKGIDSLISNYDEMAAKLLASGELNLSKNRVVGRDNKFIAEVLGFATVDHHVVDMGKKSVEMLLTNSQDIIPFDYDFIVRENA